jgi:hypothetical protein
MQEVQQDTASIASEDELVGVEEVSIPEYGFGVLYDAGWYAHDGLISGYTTMVAYQPALDFSLVTFGNSDAFSGQGTLATGIAYYEIRHILDREYPASDG